MNILSILKKNTREVEVLPSTTFSSGRRKSSAGFTLIEMLVSLALFSVVSTMAVGALLALVTVNRKEQSIKTSVNNLNAVMESMTREIRMGKDYYCHNTPPVSGSVKDCVSGAGLLGITTSKDDFFEYKLDGGQILRRVNRILLTDPFIPMTAPDVTVDTLRFYVSGTTRGLLDPQPIVTIVTSGQVGVQEGTKSDFNVQATVVQRRPDLE